MADYRDYAAEEAFAERRRIQIIEKCVWYSDGKTLDHFEYVVHGPNGYDDLECGRDKDRAILEYRLRRIEQETWAVGALPKPPIVRQA